MVGTNYVSLETQDWGEAVQFKGRRELMKDELTREPKNGTGSFW